MNGNLTAGLANVVIARLPAIFDWIRSAHAKANPDAPVPTDAEVIDALNAAIASTVAKDDQWVATHPDLPPGA